MISPPRTLYEEIGVAKIESAISKFYDQAFDDLIIGHFFVNKDKSELVRKQISFASAMLGSGKAYEGKPLKTAHKKLSIKPAHFGRRQVLMHSAMLDAGIKGELADRWIRQEEVLRRAVMSG